MIEKDISKFGFTEENIVKIAKIVSEKMHLINEKLFIPHEICFPPKIISELISKLFEKEISEFLTIHSEYKVESAKSDRDSDLTFFKNDSEIKKIEIKVTSTDKQWTGGALSKRPFDYILISWSGNYDAYFIAYTFIGKKEWEDTGDNYYGPKFTVKKLKGKDKIILMGSISGNKVIRNHIDQSKLKFISNLIGEKNNN